MGETKYKCYFHRMEITCSNGLEGSLKLLTKYEIRNDDRSTILFVFVVTINNDYILSGTIKDVLYKCNIDNCASLCLSSNRNPKKYSVLCK